MTGPHQPQRYDATLQMFCDTPCEPDMNRLTFLRWLIDHGLLEHEPASEPKGDLALVAAGAGKD